MHKEKGLWTLVHGNDYFSADDPSALDWLEIELKEQYNIKTQRIGHSSKCAFEGQIRNRLIRAIDNGFELEGDQRHAELVIEQLNLQTGKGSTSPGPDDPAEE